MVRSPRCRFYDYRAKYVTRAPSYTSLRTSRGDADVLRQTAIDAYSNDCAGLARVDFFLRPTAAYLNESTRSLGSPYQITQALGV